MRAKSTFQALARDTLEGYCHGVSVIPEPLRLSLYSDRMKRDLDGYRAVEAMRPHFDKASPEDPVAAVQYLDLKTWLPGDILTKVDRTSMAVSLEVRVPMLDHPFVEWAATLPRHMRMQGGTSKKILKAAFAPLLPHALMYRPKKGFSVPLAQWFRGPLRQQVKAAVLSEAMADSGYFDMPTLRRLIDDHQSGIKDHAAALWSLMSLGSFLQGRSRAGRNDRGGDSGRGS